MKILLLIISYIILLVSTFNLTIKAQEIKSFISKEHQFSVDFPESPSVQENTLEGATKAKAYLFNVEQATIVFSVLYINFESLDPKVTNNKEAFVRFMGNQIVKTVNGQLLGAINTSFNDFSGRSLKISAENKLLFSRLYYVNNNKDKVYQVSVAVNKPEVPANQDLILNFLNSFKLIDSNGKLISNNQNNLINNFDPSSPKPAKPNVNNSNNNNINNGNGNGNSSDSNNNSNNNSSATSNTTTDNSTNSTTTSSNSDVLSAGNKDIKQPQILQKTKPSYTTEARKNGVEGVVILSAVFRKDGSITDVKIVNGLGYGLDEEAVKAAFLIKFIPGSKDGKPVHVRARLEFTFSLL